ncbi:MBL fold metallo-hydrolase, partial [Mesorhizobium calcicola]
QVSGFYDKPTGAIQYVVADQATKQCAIIDPILDFDERSGATANEERRCLARLYQRAGSER